MNKTGLRIFAYVAIVLMLVSILPAGALAAHDNAKYNVKAAVNNGNGNRVNDSDDNTTKVRGKSAEGDYLKAKNDFAKIRSNNPKLDSAEAINATKEYLNSSINYMIALLDEDADAEYIEALEEERDNVEAAETREELADAAKNIRSIWNEARKDRVVTKGKAIDNKINAVLRKSESLIVRLQSEIATMEQNGEDVEDLEEMLAEYEELIADAREKQEQARNAYMNGNGSNGANIREANRYLVQAGEDIKDANAILRKILKELKQEREGVVVLTGNGTLTAEGNGTAVISGNVEMNITANEYTKLVIKDLAGDAVIDVDDAEYETSNIDAGNSTDNNRAFVFINITGDVFINGSRLTVMLRGSDIELTAEGTGTAVLSGEGTYDVDGESGEWATRYIDEDEDDSEDEVDDSASFSEDEDESDDVSEEEEENEEDDESSDDGDDESSDGDDTEDDDNTTETNETEFNSTELNSTEFNSTELNETTV